MRPAWPLLVLALAVPALAAPRSQRIELRYIGAGELARILAPSISQPAPFGRAGSLGDLEIAAGLIDPATGNRHLPEGLGGGGFGQGGGFGRQQNGGRGLVPPGITAWSVDPAGNALQVTGDAAAIESLKKIVRLVDIPPARIRLTVRVMDLDTAAWKALNWDTGANDVKEDPFTARVGVVPGEMPEALENSPALSVITMTVANNSPMHFQAPAAGDRPAVSASITPRLNGDGTVTLFVPAAALNAGGRAEVFALRRISPGQSVIVAPAAGRRTLVITVRKVETRQKRQR
jgi:hypothetical protein